MDVSAVCRICLSTKVIKDISDLKTQENDLKTSFDIVLFCLNIQVDDDSNISTKLCLKCSRKIMSFYDFKLLALRNDAYLKDLEFKSIVKSETCLDKDLKNEELCSNDFEAEIPLGTEIKLEQDVEYDNEDQENSLSDDELLSDIKKVKYEFVPEVAIKSKKNVPKKGTRVKKTKAKSGTCNQCGENVEKLTVHQKHHRRERDTNGRLPCQLCDKTFASDVTRYNHKYKVHLGVKKTCPICKKAVLDLRGHTLNVHDTSKRQFECGVCEKRFPQRTALRAHESTHSTERPYACDVCGKKFRIQKQLVTHKRATHEKLKPHMCHFCSKSFSTGDHLRRHLRAHTDERPYKCKECAKMFTNTTGLKNHMFVHMDDKRFTCEVCGKKFAAPRYLTNHMLCHTRVKRFSCHFCDWKFHRSDHVKQHETAVHKIQKLISSDLK